MEHKHDTKVALYGADGGRMGETFSRRARQLVKQQRATWMNEDHTAIQFIADEPEAWEAEPAAYTPHAHDKPHMPTNDAALLEMARTRLSARRWFIVHLALLIPGYLFIAVIVQEMFRSWGWRNYSLGFVIGAAAMFWTMTFFFTVYRFFKYNRGYQPFVFNERRKAQRLADEVELLRKMGYGK